MKGSGGLSQSRHVKIVIYTKNIVMEQKEQRVQLLNKLLAIKEQVGYFKKDAKSYNYSYTSGTAILSQINPLMLEHKLLLVPKLLQSNCRDAISIVKGKEKPEYAFDLVIEMTWVDTETGHEYPVPWYGSGQNSGEKGFGSALTYAERYFLLKFFQIATDDDDPDTYERNYQQKHGRSTAATKKIIENKKKASTSIPDESRPSPDLSNPPEKEVTKKEYEVLYEANKDLFPKELQEKMKYNTKWAKMLPAVYDRLQQEIAVHKSKEVKK
jgi:hypothetical protein